MDDLNGQPARVRSRRHIEPLGKLRQTLGDHYRRKRKHYGASWPDQYDPDLLRIFSDEPRYARRDSASKFLRDIRSEMRQLVARGTGAHPYTIDQVLQDMTERCRELKLRLAVPRAQARMQAIVLVTVHTMSCVQRRRHEIPV